MLLSGFSVSCDGAFGGSSGGSGRCTRLVRLGADPWVAVGEVLGSGFEVLLRNWKWPTLWLCLIPKPYSYCRYLIGEDHFHSLGFGISGGYYRVFYGGAGVWS